MTTMRISQLAERSGVPASTLRFYEDAGLLSAGRTESGYRVYGEDAVERLAFIGAAKRLGLPLDEIGELLAVWQSGACAEVKADLRPRISARLTEAEQRAAELAVFADSLRTALAHLDALPDRSTPCDPECGLLIMPAPTAGQQIERWRSEPVVCSLAGEGMSERIVQWRAALDGATRAEIPDGMRLTAPADRLLPLAELAAAEQRCCPFFDFRFHLDGQVLHMEVRASAEGAGMLADLFAPASDPLQHRPGPPRDSDRGHEPGIA
jgi:DNA-binding transcriptional MerR regulator